MALVSAAATASRAGSAPVTTVEQFDARDVNKSAMSQAIVHPGLLCVWNYDIDG